MNTDDLNEKIAEIEKQIAAEINNLMHPYGREYTAQRLSMFAGVSAEAPIEATK